MAMSLGITTSLVKIVTGSAHSKSNRPHLRLGFLAADALNHGKHGIATPIRHSFQIARLLDNLTAVCYTAIYPSLGSIAP